MNLFFALSESVYITKIQVKIETHRAKAETSILITLQVTTKGCGVRVALCLTKLLNLEPLAYAVRISD